MKILARINASLFVFSLLLLIAPALVCQTTGRDWKVYDSRKLGFRLKHASDLKLHIGPNGVIVLNRHANGRQIFVVTNDAFPYGSENARKPGRFFRRLRNFSPETTIENEWVLYRKIENLMVDGRPAVKVEVRSKPQIFESCPECCQAPHFSAIKVVVSDGKRFWEMSVFTADSYLEDQDLEKSFDEILSTFRFR
jgi:hypothetical protein